MSASEYPRRLGNAWSKLDHLRSLELGWNGPNPCLNSSFLSDENYARLCGAMDSIHDMDGALFGFWQKIHKNIAPSELECVGFLQAITIQQDCVREIYQATGNRQSFCWHDDTKRARELRNRISGHPAFASDVSPKGSAMWHPPSISPDGFEITIYYVKGQQNVFVDFRGLLRANHSGLGQMLEDLIALLNQPDSA